MANAFSAKGLLTALMARAINVSSLWRRGLLLPRWVVFTFWMGSMASREIKWSCLPMPARDFKALSMAAEDAPNRSVVLPVTMVPSGREMAMAGRPVSSATANAGVTTVRISGVIFACCIKSSSL